MLGGAESRLLFINLRSEKIRNIESNHAMFVKSIGSNIYKVYLVAADSYGDFLERYQMGKHGKSLNYQKN